MRVKTVETIRYISALLLEEMLDAKVQGAEKFISGEKCTPQFGFLGR
jgi:hypothetical protein